jgi:hypothetical protein
MPKYLWILLIGGGITYAIHKTHKSYAYGAGIITAIIAYMNWR